MSLSHGQQVALAVVPKVSGFLSLVGSTIIVTVVVRDRKKRREPYHRLIGATSCIDISSSFCGFLSTWPIPKASGVLWAAGNVRTCTAQGFFIHLAVISGMYSASLSFYYVLTIVHGWKKNKFQKVEPWLHLVPLTFGIATSITNIFLTNYNPALLWCAIASVPHGCTGSECIRGENAEHIYRWAFFYAPLWIAFLIQTVNVLIVITYVWKIEKKSQSHTFATQSNGSPPADLNDSSGTCRQKKTRQSDMKRTKRVAWQCFLYALGFYITWTPATVVRILHEVNGMVGFAGLLLFAITGPLQGLPNFCVYFIPMVLQRSRQFPGRGMLSHVRGAFAPTRTTSSQPSDSIHPNGASLQTTGRSSCVMKNAESGTNGVANNNRLTVLEEDAARETNT